MKFGVVIHKPTMNLGDDIQTYAAAKLLPHVDYQIDREYISDFKSENDEPVAVILPDVILDEYESDLSQDNLAEMIRRFDETGHSQIMVEPVADVTAYGVVDCKGVELAPGESVPMVGVVEKPKADVAPSNLAIVGRYVLSADIWPLLAKTPPGAGDEIQLTDAIDMLIEKETVEAYHMKGKSHDCGNKLGYMQAFVEYGIRHNTLGTEFKAWLEEEMGIKK